MTRRLRGSAGQRFRAAVFARYGDTCHLCGLPGADTADHLTPLSLGGTNSIDNARPAHRSCNSSRGAAQLSADPELAEDNLSGFFEPASQPGHPAPRVEISRELQEKSS